MSAPTGVNLEQSAPAVRGVWRGGRCDDQVFCDVAPSVGAVGVVIDRFAQAVITLLRSVTGCAGVRLLRVEPHHNVAATAFLVRPFKNSSDQEYVWSAGVRMLVRPVSRNCRVLFVRWW